jgi:arylformamidase
MSLISFEIKGKSLQFDSNQGTDLSLPVTRNGLQRAFNLPAATFEPFRYEQIVLALKEGGSVNCEMISVYPHGNGTHTETSLHVLENGPFISEIKLPAFMLAHIVTVKPELSDENRVIKQLPEHIFLNEAEAVIIRTAPNLDVKKTLNYSNTHPVYFDDKLLRKLKENGIKHLLTDLPSVDAETDGGLMLAHKAFFQENPEATITELIFVPDSLSDGLYLLNLQISSIETDAVPSRPIVFPLKNISA